MHEPVDDRSPHLAALRVRSGWLLSSARKAISELVGGGLRAPDEVIDASALHYPLLGLALGAAWLGADWIGTRLAGRVGGSLSVLLVAAALTRGRPMQACGRLLSALATGRRSAALARLAGKGDARAWLAVGLVAAAELACLLALDASRQIGLVFAPLLGRWSMVVLAVGSRAARLDGRRLKFAAALGFSEFAWASSVTFAVVFGVAEFLGVLLAVAAAAATVVLRVLLHRWLDGVTTTTLDAVCEVVQLLTLATLVALQ